MSELGIFGALRRAFARSRFPRLSPGARALLLAALASPSGAALAGAGQANIVGGENQLAAPGNALPTEITVRNDASFPQDLRVYIDSDSTGGATLNSGQVTVDITGVPGGETRTVTVTLGPGTGIVTIATCALDAMPACVPFTEDSTVASTATLAAITGSGSVDQGEVLQVQVEAENGGGPAFNPATVEFTVTGPASPASFSTMTDYITPATLNLTIDPAAPGGSVVQVTALRTDVTPHPAPVTFTFIVNDYQLIQVSPPDGTPAQAGSVQTLTVRALYNGGPPNGENASRRIKWEIVADPSGSSTLTGGLTTTTTDINFGETDTSIDLTIGAPNTTAAMITVRATAFEPPPPRGAGAIPVSNVRTVEFAIDPFDVLTVTSSSGNGQSAAVGAPVTNPLVVAVTRNGQPDAGQLIDWSVSPANAVTFTGGASTAQSTVDPSGNAQISITSVNTDGPITITAAHNQDPAVSTTFTLTGTNPTLTYDTVTGDNQSASTGAGFPNPLRLRVLRNGNPESNVVIDWSVNPPGAVTLNSGQTTTDANGFTQVTATAGNTGGPVTVTASRADDPSVTFSYTLQIIARTLVKPSTGSGDNQFGMPGQTLPQQLSVQALLNGSSEPGVTIDWTVVSGTATVTPTVNPTDGNGFSRAQVVLGTTPGVVTIEARRSDVPSQVQTFTVTIVEKVLVKPSTGSGDNQTGMPGQTLPQLLSVQALLNGASESGVTINWSVVSGTATVTPTVNPTDNNGFSRAQVTLGTTPGPVTIEARRADVPTQVQTFTLTIVQQQLVKPSTNSGDNQTGVPGQPAPQPLAAQALSNGAPESGVTINWTVLSGDATLGGISNPTDNGGLSTAQVIFGPTAGPVTVQAQRADVPSEVQVYNLTATATRTLEKPSVGSGDGQSAPIGSTLPERLVVIARNNAIAAPGVDVLWTVTGGTATLSASQTTTGADGSTSVQVTFGNVPGTVTVRATRADDPNASSSFVLTATSVTQPNLSLEKPDGSGDGTSAPVGTDVVLQARAVIGTSPQADIEVLWELVSGSARVLAPRGFSDRQGLVATTVTLGPNAGGVVVRAVRTDSGASQTYQLTATGTGSGALLEIIDGNNQTGAPGSAARPLRVRLSQNGTALASQTITWTVLSGSATLDGSSSVTNANGEAQVGLTFGDNPGDVQVRAAAGNVTALFTLRVGSPGAMLTLVSGNRQTGPVGSRAALPIVVELSDGLGGLLANQAIQWTVLSGSATLDSATTTTGIDGRSSQGLRFGNTAGPIRIRAEVPALVPAVFVEIEATSFTPTLSIVSGNNQSAPAGTQLPQDFVVSVAPPAGGGTLGGVTVRWQVASGGGTLAAATSTTGSDGRASNRLTLGPNAVGNTVTASVDGGGSVTFTATGTAPAGPLTIVSGNNQTLPTRTDSAPLVVELKTTAGVPIRDATLVWTGDNATLRSVRTTTDLVGRSENVAQVLLPGAARITVQVEGGSGAASTSVTFNLTGGVANIPQLGDVEETIGGAVDNLCPALVALANPTPAQVDLRARCLELVNNAGANPQQVESALDQLREDVALAQANAALLTAATQFDNLKTRIAALRSGARGADLGGLAIANSSGVMPLSFLPSAVVQSEDGTEGGGEAEVGSDFSRWGFFASGIIGRGEQEAGRVTPEYDFDTSGLTAGVDYRVNDQWIVGGSLGFNRQDTDLADDGGGIDTDGWSVSGYTTWYRENNWYFDGVLTVGSNDYDMTRSIVYDIVGAGGSLTTVDQLARASTSGDVLSTAFSVGRDFNKGPWNFGPYLRATYTAVDFDGYEEELESGIGSGLGLAVESRQLKSMTGVLGGKVTYTMSRDWGILMPHAQLEWEHEFRDDPQAVVTRFLHDPTGTRVRLSGDEVDTDYYNIGFGLSALFPGGRSAFFYYEHLAGSEGQSQDNLSIGVRIEF
jgi:uncharacterized protein YhjY with autotransporter beta-barrel domain